jgi:hypothetical protein
MPERGTIHMAAPGSTVPVDLAGVPGTILRAPHDRARDAKRRDARPIDGRVAP